MTFDELKKCFYVNENDCNEAVYKELLHALKENRVTPVIGAGLSAWAYPQWKGLLTDMADGYGIEADVAELLDKYEYEEAAARIEEEYGARKFQDRLKKEFDPEIVRKNSNNRPKYQKHIPQLFKGAIVTTNFDRAIEHLFELNKMEQPVLLTPDNAELITKAMRLQESVLVKLHGDVKSSDKLVLTKDAYNETYGDDPKNPDTSKPMPQELKKILEHKQALFLGCSLNVDRTYHVIKSCADLGDNFAIMELPVETENKSDPYAPYLRKSKGGRLKRGLRKRINELRETLNIKVIWYPHGKHDEALGAFFTQLAADMGISAEPTKDKRYTPLHTLVGRDNMVDAIADRLSKDTPTCAWVWGTGGIGKTEICRGVYAKMEKECDGFEMPFIDITGKSNLMAFYQAVANATGVSLENIKADDIPNYLITELKRKYESGNFMRALYFDNCEDIWYGVDNDEDSKKELVKWMDELLNGNVRLLVSSRVDSKLSTKAKTIVQQFEIKPLDKKESEQIFLEVLDRDIVESEQEAFDFLIKELDGHPLAIVLTASQAKDEDTHLDNIKTRWEDASQEIYEHTEHKNLATALRMSWNAIKNNQAAVIQWGLHYYSVGPIPRDVLQEFRIDFSDDEWREGSTLLRKASLTYVTEDREAVSMLLPVKKQFVKLIGLEKEIQWACLLNWVIYVNALLEFAGCPIPNPQTAAYQRVLPLFPQIFYIMEQLMVCKEDVAQQMLDQIVVNAQNYYMFNIQSITILEKLTNHYAQNGKSLLLAIVKRCQGDLLSLKGYTDRAETTYKAAEKLYEEVGDKLGQANVKISQGDLLSLKGDTDGAEDAYEAAEKLYEDVGATLGQANVKRCQGELLRLKGDLKGAESAYKAAEKLYKEVGDRLGQAHVKRSQGHLLRADGKPDKAYTAYKEAKELYRQMQEPMGLSYTLAELYVCCMQLKNLSEAEEVKAQAQAALDKVPYEHVKKYVLRKLNTKIK